MKLFFTPLPRTERGGAHLTVFVRFWQGCRRMPGAPYLDSEMWVVFSAPVLQWQRERILGSGSNSRARYCAIKMGPRDEFPG
jgi:hypothetical protein